MPTSRSETANSFSVDFGLARGSRPDIAPIGDGVLGLDLTSPGGLLGTPAYMAPEQLDGQPADPASDQFAFAVSLWEALTGERPFRSKGSGLDAIAELRVEIASGPCHAAHDRALPRPIERIVRRALAEDPAQRWPSMASLADALDRSTARPRPLPWLAAIAAIAGIAATAVATPSATSPAPAPEVVAAPQLGAPHRLASYGGDRVGVPVVLLSGGWFARGDGDGIAITALDGSQLQRVSWPAGVGRGFLGKGAGSDELVVSTHDGRCATWQVSAVNAFAPIPIPVASCSETAVLSPDHAWVAELEPGRLRVRTSDGSMVRWSRDVTMADVFASDLAWGSDGQHALGDGNTLTVVDAATGESVATVDGARVFTWMGSQVSPRRPRERTDATEDVRPGIPARPRRHDHRRRPVVDPDRRARRGDRGRGKHVLVS